MGNVYAEIALRNLGDLMLAKNGHLGEKNIREIALTAMVDTGAWTLVIGEKIREKLGLDIHGEDWVTLANGVTETVRKVDPVEVQWKNRKMICQPIMIPSAEEVLLGAIPLEDMDLMVDPRNEELVGRHGDKIIRRL